MSTEVRSETVRGIDLFTVVAGWVLVECGIDVGSSIELEVAGRRRVSANIVI